MAQRFQATYRIEDEKTLLNAEELNQRFRDLDSRLHLLESTQLSIEVLLEELRLNGITRLTSLLQQALPGILADAQSGYLNGLALGAIPWNRINTSGANASVFGAEPAGTLAAHLNASDVHQISDIAGLQTVLSGKQDASGLLDSIAEETPINGGVVIGNGTAFQVEEIEAGDSIAITRINGKLRINATGSASGESNSASSVGAGVGLPAGKSGTVLQFKSLLAAHQALAWSSDADEVTLALDESKLSIPVNAVQNLPATIAALQPANALLAALASSSPGENLLLMGTGASIDWRALTAGSNIAISPTQGGGLTISATAAGETNTGESRGNGEAVYAGKNGTTLRFKSLLPGGPIRLTGASDTISISADLGAIASGFADGAISWAKISKSGATAAQVGAEPAGAVAAHASASAAHAIGQVSGLTTALNACLTKSAAEPQAIESAIAIVPQVLSGASVTPNAALDNYFTLTLTGNTTINNPTGLPAGICFLDFTISQDGAGGRAMTWGNAYRWGDAGQPAWKTTSNAVNIVTFKAVGGVAYFLGHRAY